MIVDKINHYLSNNNLQVNDALAYQVEKLAGWSFKRQFMDNSEKKIDISMSQAGKCARQIAYKFHNFELAGKEIDSRAKIIFWQGDMAELMIVALASIAGCQVVATGFQQIRTEMPFKRNIGFEDEDYIVSGYPDGILIADKIYLVEVKSMSSFRFADFTRKVIDEEYLTQINMYMHSLNLRKCVVLAMNKNNGLLGEQIVEYDKGIVQAGINNINTVLASTSENLPEPKYAPSDAKLVYPWQCLYCGHWKLCRPNAEKVLVGKSYKLKEKIAN
jgi:hypothetical protein